MTNRKAWYALTVLVVAIIFGFVDRQILVLVVEPIKQDLGLSDLEVGALNGLGPALFAVVAGYPLAWLADRMDRRLLLIICILFWSAATGARAFADSFMGLMVFTVAIAVGEAVLTPVTYSLIPDLFRGSRRDTANFVFFGAVTVGVGLGLMLGGGTLGLVEQLRPGLPAYISDLSGWRIAFLLVAGPGILVALSVLPISAKRSSLAQRGQQEGEVKTSILPFIRSHWRSVLAINSAGSMYGLSMGILGIWLPIAIIREFALPAEDVGVQFGLAYFLGAIGGIGLAMASTNFWRKSAGHNYAVRAISVMSAVATPAILALAFAPTAQFAYFAAGAAIMLMIAGTAFSPSMLQNLAPPRLRARVSAIFMVLYAGVGASGPMLLGLLSDYTDVNLMVLVGITSGTGLVLCALLYRIAERYYQPFIEDEAESEGAAMAPVTTVPGH